MEKSNFKQIINYEINPFKVEGIVERFVTLKVGETLGVEMSTGEQLIIKKLPQSKLVTHDGAIYTKLFRTGLISRLNHLSKPATNMFLMIASRLAPHSEKVCITEDDFMETFEYARGSKRLYYQSITELEEKKVIAKVNNSSRCYWINPNVMFNGDRTKLAA